MTWRQALGYLLGDEPWEKPEIDLKSEGLKAMIARAEADNEREAGAGVVPKFSRDPVVERRERKVEQMTNKPAAIRLAWKAQS